MNTSRVAAVFLTLLLFCATPRLLYAGDSDVDALITFDEAAMDLLTGDLPTRVAALTALSALNSAEATDALTLATLDSSPDVRRLAYAALGPRDVDLSLFRRGLADDASAVRIATISAVAQQSSTPRLELLVGSLSHSDAGVAEAAGLALLQRHPRAIPACDLLTKLWNAAGESKQWRLEFTLAALMLVRDAEHCTLPFEEVQRARKQAGLFAQLQTYPELGAAFGSFALELEALQARHDKVLDEDPDIWTTCANNIDRNGVLDAARYALERGLGANGEALLEFRRELEGTTAFVEALERCSVDPDAYHSEIYALGGGPGISLPADNPLAPLELTASLETTFDDHFLARRQDLPEVRVISELASDLVVRAKLASPPAELPDDLAYRARLQLSDTLDVANPDLNAVGAFADFTHLQRFGPELTVFSAVEAERDPADSDRGWPQRLVAPGLHARGIFGAKSLMYETPDNNYGYFPGGWKRFPDWAVAVGASADHYDALDSVASGLLLPQKLEDSTRFGVEADALYKFYSDYDQGAYIDVEADAFFYAVGMPTLKDGAEHTRDDPAFLVAVEPGIFYEDHEVLFLAQVGATFAHYPAPTDSELLGVSGILYGELAENERGDLEDGGQLWAALTADRFDDPTLADASTLYGLASGFTIIEQERDYVVEFDFSVVAQTVTHSLLGPDPTGYRAGFTTFVHFSTLGFPGFSFGYSLMGEQDDLREDRFLEELGESHSRGIIRNMVMLNVYGASFFPDLNLVDDRDPNWGLNRLRKANVPMGWWQ